MSPCRPELSGCLQPLTAVIFFIFLSAQDERRSGRAALYLCFDWPGGEPEVRLLSPGQQFKHLPLHAQVWPSSFHLLDLYITLTATRSHTPVISVTSRGLRCSTSFSTTWPTTSPKDRWETSLKANLVKGRSKVNPLALCARQTKEMKLLLAALYKQSVPPAAGSLTLQMVSLRQPPPTRPNVLVTHTHT